MRRTPIKPKRKREGIPLEVRYAVQDRSGGVCEVEGCKNPAEEMHHRRMRSAGGKHTVDNLLHACGSHHRHIHRNPAWSYRRGYLLKGHGIAS